VTAIESKVAKEEEKVRRASAQHQKSREEAQRRRDRQLDRAVSSNSSAVEELRKRIDDLENGLLDRVREDVAADPSARRLSFPRLSRRGHRPRAHEDLKARNLDVWFDGAELRLGEPLMRQLDRGIARSRCGVLLLTNEFLKGRFWGEREMTALVGSRRRVIPVLTGVSFEELEQYSSILSAFVGLDLDMHGMAEVAEQIGATVG
jgi:hypothetical protein